MGQADTDALLEAEANWLIEIARKAEARLRAIPVEERSPVVRKLVGPYPSPCEHCGGTGIIWTGALGPDDD